MRDRYTGGEVLKTPMKSTSLRRRLLVLVSAITLTLFGLLVVMEGMWLWSRYESETGNSVEIAQAVGLAFQSFVNDVNRQQNAIGTALRLFAPPDSETIARYLDRAQEPYPAVREYAIVDSAGTIRISSSDAGIGISVADRPYFRRLLAGDTVVISDYLRARSLGISGFVIGRAFFSDAGRLDFAVMAGIEAARLGDNALKLDHPIGQYLTLFDSEGTLVYTNQDPEALIETNRTWVEEDHLLRKALRGETATGFYSVPVTRDPNRIGARVPIPGTGWVAGSGVARAQFFLPTLLSFALVLLVSILIAGIVYLLARRTVNTISQSLASVQQHMNQVAQGRFTASAATSGLLEFDSLMQDTNTMARRLKDREERLRLMAAIVENSNDFIGLASPDFKPFFLNQAGRRMVGLEPDTDVSTTQLLDYFHPDDRPLIETAAIPALSTQERWIGEVRFRNIRTEESIPTLWNAFSIRDTAGNLLAWATISPDLSVIKKGAEDLRTSQEFGAKILDSSLNGLYIYNFDEGALTFINAEYTRLTGFTQEELNEMRGESFLDRFHTDDRSRVQAHIASIQGLRDEETRLIEYRFRRKDGVWIWCLSREAVFSRDEQGTVIQYIGTFIDITDRKDAEEALIASEQRFRTLADSMPQLVWTARPDGTVDYYNKRYHDFGGITPGPDGTWQWTPVLHEEDLQPTSEAWNHAVATGEVYQVEHRIRHADGSFHWYLSRGIPARDDQGSVVKWYGSATNIDSIKQAQAALFRSEEHLRILNSNLENIIIARTEQARVLSKALTLAEQRERKRFSYILHENLQQLLLGAKLLLGQHLRDHETVAPAEPVDDVAESFTLLEKALSTTRSLSVEINPPVLRTQGLDAALEWLSDHMQKTYRLEVSLEMQGPVARIREETQLMLTQMVRELLSNVVQHAGVLLARVEVACEGHHIHITVSDAGHGFNPDEVALETGGGETRLGLFSIRERLKLFGGDFSVDSGIGLGTRCTIVSPSDAC